MHFALENRFKPGLNQYFGVNYVNLAGESQFGLWPALRFGSRLPRQFAKVRVEDRLWVGSLLTTSVAASNTLNMVYDGHREMGLVLADR